MALIRDCSTIVGATEWGGIQDGSPPLSTNLKQASSFPKAGGGNYVPPNGCPVMQFYQASISDGHYFGSTSYRTLTRQFSDAQFSLGLRGPGFESWTVFACLTPSGFGSSGSIFTAPWEMHQDGTGGSTGVAPGHITLKGNGLDVFFAGGSTAAGGIGNPGRVTTYSHLFTDSKFVTRDAWHVFVVRYRHGMQGVSYTAGTGGCIELWHGIPGTDSAPVSLTGTLNNVYTLFGARKNYQLLGVYMDNVSSVHHYTAGWREYSSQSEAIAWATTMLGGVVAPPPPDPSQLTFIGNWAGPSFVDTVTGTRAPSSFGPWTSSMLVHPYNPAPASAFEGNWTSPLVVDSASGVVDVPPDPVPAGTLTLTPYPVHAF